MEEFCWEKWKIRLLEEITENHYARMYDIWPDTRPEVLGVFRTLYIKRWDLTANIIEVWYKFELYSEDWSPLQEDTGFQDFRKLYD